MAQPAAKLEEPMIDQAVFEGLFLRALQVPKDPRDAKDGGAFLRDLKAAGYDPAQPSPRYPARVFREALLVACRHVHPGKAQETALYELGKAFLDGFFNTIIGKLMGTMLPFLSLEMVVKRLPRFSTMTSSVSTEYKAEQVEPGVWRVTMINPTSLPEFTLGALDQGLRKGKLGTARIVEKISGGAVYEFRAGG